VILGAGCAGLSLAINLALNNDYTGRTLLVDRRDCYTQDRTWCFFSPDNPALVPRELISSQWKSGVIRTDNDYVRLDFGDKPYVLVDASDFYAYAFRILGNDPRFSFALGRSVGDQSLTVDADTTFVKIDGDLYQTGMLVDTRNDRLAEQSKPTLWQVFIGMEIMTDRSTFDPEAAVIMDFVKHDDHPVSFLYVLPASANQALVEYTVFSTSPIDPESLKPNLVQLLACRFGLSHHDIIRVERGAIPMGRARARSDSTNRIRSGLIGGAARPSTGYAFLRIQRWAKACSEALIEDQRLVGMKEDPLLTKVMDHLFLKVISRNSISAETLFFELFKNTPTPSLIRFLNDEGSTGDHLRVISSLPKSPFVRALLR
jgi:lycopene beta-cyclase